MKQELIGYIIHKNKSLTDLSEIDFDAILVDIITLYFLSLCTRALNKSSTVEVDIWTVVVIDQIGRDRQSDGGTDIVGLGAGCRCRTAPMIYGGPLFN